MISSTEVHSPSYTEVLSVMCSMHCPNLAALWLGAAISGLSTMIMAFVETGSPPLDPDASAWTGCPQSFMDIPGSGSYIRSSNESGGGRISRADAWRLLYLPPVDDDDLYYNSPPFSPWEPIGTTTFEHSVIRVRIHKNCPRHRLVYQHFSWRRKDGSALKDTGFKPDPDISITDLPSCCLNDNIVTTLRNLPTRLLPDQEASIIASQEVSGWVTRNGEGYPPEAIYWDEWLGEGEDNDDDGGVVKEPLGAFESSSNKASDHARNLRTRVWIAEVMETVLVPQ